MDKSHSLIESFRHAIDGFLRTVREERNMRIHCAMTVVVVACSVVLGLTALEKALLFILCGLVITAELFNTAIENAVDISAPTFNMFAKKAKDSSAAAVLIISIIAAAVGIIIFWPYGMEIIDYIQHLI